MVKEKKRYLIKFNSNKKFRERKQKFGLMVSHRRYGFCYFTKTTHNLFANLTDFFGNTLFTKSCNSCIYDATKKRVNGYSGSLLAEHLAKKARSFYIIKVKVILYGLSIRNYIVRMMLRTLMGCGVRILEVIVKSVRAHNGCRLPKMRRL